MPFSFEIFMLVLQAKPTRSFPVDLVRNPLPRKLLGIIDRIFQRRDFRLQSQKMIPKQLELLLCSLSPFQSLQHFRHIALPQRFLQLGHLLVAGLLWPQRRFGL